MTAYTLMSYRRKTFHAPRRAGVYALGRDVCYHAARIFTRGWDGRLFMDASEEKAEERARIVVVGGGFGGLFTALGLAGAGEVTLVAADEHFLHTPLLYEYLSGEVEAWHIAPPYRELFGENKIRFVQG